MTRSTFFVVLCITSLVVVGSLAIAANPGSDTDPSIENALAIQKAMVQAKDFLLRSETKKAVDVLEASLSRVNGDRRYLMLLRDAYRAHIKDLALANQPAQVDVYQKRLKILDDNDPPAPGAIGSLSGAGVQPPQVTTAQVQESPKPAAPKQPDSKPERPPVVKAPSDPVIGGAPAPSPGEAAPGYVARGKLDLTLDPFDPANERTFTAGVAEQQNLAQNLLARGDAEFKQKHYAQAKQLYEQAFQSDSRLQSQEARNAWAYCQLALVVENINRYPEQPCDWARLEADVKQAVQAAPHLAKSGETILADMMKRRAAVPADLTRAAPAVAVKHLPRGEHGWLVAETSHFRVFHKQSSDCAEKVVQVAENTRVQMSRKWFGKDVADWTLKCDIYLHATAADYSQFTRESAASPGHSRIELDPTNGRVVSRQVHMRCDNPAMLEAILPHETTHVVLAGNFGSKHVPRWVDEGVAVLTEPPEKVQQHRKNLVTSLQNRELIPLRDLMQLDNYPQPRQVATFYAQSVALVDFLTRQKGPQVFTQFVREALRDGYEPALRKNYGFQGFAELQDRFTERILAEAKGSGAAYAER